MNSLNRGLAPAPRGSCDPDERYLRSLYCARQWFRLRGSTFGIEEQKFYKFAVSCAFNQIDELSSDLEHYLNLSVPCWHTREIHRLLSWAHVRRGNFAQALQHLVAAWGTMQTDDALFRRWPLFATLARLPEQSVLHNTSCTLSYEMVDGNMFVAARVHDQPLNCMIDSGANISFMTETTARQLGMKIHPLPPHQCQMYGATGAHTTYMAANAEEVRLGSFRLANVPFLIVKDDQLDFPARYQSALGLTVLLAFTTLCWEPDHTLHIGASPSASDLPTPNLCFDDADPILHATVQHQDILLLLDTGNGQTILGQPFAKRFPHYHASLTPNGRMQIHGVSGRTEVDCVTLKYIIMRIGNTDLVLSPAHILQRGTTPKSRWLHGSVGIDLLNRAKRITMDFRSMTLALE